VVGKKNWHEGKPQAGHKDNQYHGIEWSLKKHSQIHANSPSPQTWMLHYWAADDSWTSQTSSPIPKETIAKLRYSDAMIVETVPIVLDHLHRPKQMQRCKWA